MRRDKILPATVICGFVCFLFCIDFGFCKISDFNTVIIDLLWCKRVENLTTSVRNKQGSFEVYSKDFVSA